MRIQEIVDGLRQLEDDMNTLLLQAHGAGLVVRIEVHVTRGTMQQSIAIVVGTPIQPTPKGGPF